MDWCLDPRVAGACDAVERDIAAHLARHAVEPGTVELARPTVRGALNRPDREPVWVTLDWTGHQCALRVRPAPSGRLVGTPLAEGATRAHDHAARLASARRDPPVEEVVGEEVFEVGVARMPEQDIDLPPSGEPWPPAGEPWLPARDRVQLLGLISSEVDRGHSLEEAAARAGATVAAHVMAGAPVADDPGEVAARMVQVEADLGADFEVVEVDRGRAVLRNRRCPFGPRTGRSMCRFTSALAGGLAARASGRSEVSVVESLAAGDHECRLVVDTAGGLDRRVSHRYVWPPSQEGQGEQEPDGGKRAFHLTLSLQLPRDRLSVPITRHLVRAAMDEIGVVSDDGDAVDLAVTEACANVIDHSGPGDAYDVAVTISPSACHIRVVDVGRGFDHEALSLSGMASHDAEHGRGVALMHALVDQVRFESEPERGTVVHLVKRLRFEESAVAHRLMGEATSSG